MNRNYVRGRAYEYKIKKRWEEKGYLVVRASGSHGPFDLVLLRPAVGSVILVQCKVTKNKASARALLKSFHQKPPLTESRFTQMLQVQCGKEEFQEWA